MSIVILYVDDRPELPAGLKESLAEEGYELLYTGDPEQAMEIARERAPALVLMELDLRGCDGPDLLDGMRSCRPDAAGLPVVVVSRAARSSGLHGEAIALGAKDFFTKPVLASQLISTIQEIAPPPPPEPEPEPPPPPDPNAFEGELSETPLPELLVRLRRRGASGVLITTRDGSQIGVQLRNGSPLAVTSTSGYADPVSVVGEGCSWTEGSFRFAEGKRLKADSSLELEPGPAQVVLNAVVTCAPPSHVADRLRKRASLYVSFAEEDEGPVEALTLGAEIAGRLAGLDGSKPLADLLDDDALTEPLLYGLWAAGWLDLHVAPTLPLLEEIGEITPGPAAPPAASLDPDETQPLVDDLDDLGGFADAEPAKERPSTAVVLRELAQRVLAADDFEALDVPLFAPDGQVRSAYEERLAEIPPEAFSSPDPELRLQATRIRDRIESAWEHLRDAETRRAHALLRQEEDQDRNAATSAPRALEAERWYRKGQGQLESKRYGEAAESFGMASHLDPNEGEYLAHLGYALYLSKPGEDVVRKEAMEHIANGIKRSPDRELPYVYLARILNAKGDSETARKVLRRALRVKPGCLPAQRELRLIEMRDKKKGLLGRLFGR